LTAQRNLVGFALQEIRHFLLKMLSSAKFLRTGVASSILASKSRVLRKNFVPQQLARGFSTHESYDPSKVRNVAIIAHVDHGMQLMTLIL
jgi:hypothetical protein